MPSLQELIGFQYAGEPPLQLDASDETAQPQTPRAAAAWELKESQDMTFSPKTDPPSPRRGSRRNPSPSPLLPSATGPLLGGRDSDDDESFGLTDPQLMTPAPASQRRTPFTPSVESAAAPAVRALRDLSGPDESVPPPAPVAPSPAQAVPCGPRERAQAARDGYGSASRRPPPAQRPVAHRNAPFGATECRTAAARSPRADARSRSPRLLQRPAGAGLRVRSASADCVQRRMPAFSPAVSPRSAVLAATPARPTSPVPKLSARQQEAVHNRLYESAAAQRQKRAVAERDARVRRNAEEVAAVAKARVVLGNGRVRELVDHLSNTKRRESDIDRMRRLRDEAEMLQCTFRPQLGKEAGAVAGRNRGNHVLARRRVACSTDRLHAEGARRSAWRQRAAEERDREEKRRLEQEKREANPRYAERRRREEDVVRRFRPSPHGMVVCSP